jgi:Na+/melibiose symporter-like transporter
MVSFQQWCARIGAVAAAVIATVLVPAAAFASSGPGSVAIEAVRRRPRGAFGFLGGLCCLVVLGIIVVVLLLVMRNRRSGPPR